MEKFNWAHKDWPIPVEILEKDLSRFRLGYGFYIQMERGLAEVHAVIDATTRDLIISNDEGAIQRIKDAAPKMDCKIIEDHILYNAEQKICYFTRAYKIKKMRFYSSSELIGKAAINGSVIWGPPA